MTWLDRTQLNRIERKLDALIQRMEIDMSELDAELTDIETAEAAEHADIERVITDLEAKDQAGTLTDDERTRLEALKAEIAADTAAIDAADPAPPAA